MKLLAFDTSTDTLSIAVGCGTSNGMQTWDYTGSGGAQASTDLIPKVMELMAQAQLRLEELDAICFGAGPGSFTGLRTACSVAQGLAFGAQRPVLAVNTLLAVAETARWQVAAQAEAFEVTTLLDARMDEMYAARFAFLAGKWTELESAALVPPAGYVVPHVAAGNVFKVYADRLNVSDQTVITCLPTAAAMLRLAPQLLAEGKSVSAEQALPLYIRDKVAKTTAERAADKAALSAAG
jgi:tRNA threonylcarbamoyladenosine biosynthesis protein TsaB